MKLNYKCSLTFIALKSPWKCRKFNNQSQLAALLNRTIIKEQLLPLYTHTHTLTTTTICKRLQWWLYIQHAVCVCEVPRLLGMLRVTFKRITNYGTTIMATSTHITGWLLWFRPLDSCLSCFSQDDIWLCVCMCECVCVCGNVLKLFQKADA